MKVLISLGKSYYAVFDELGKWLRKEGIEVVEQIGYDYAPPKELIKQLVKDVDVYIVGVDVIDKEIIDEAKNLKLIIKHGVGFNNIDLEYAKKKNIAVTFARGCNAQSVAELAIALMLSVCRGIPQSSENVKKGEWNLFMGHELCGKTLGLIGYGNIGSKVAKIALAFGMTVLAFDPYICADILKKDSVTPKSKEEIFSESDFISLHVPVTDENIRLINSTTLKLMKKSAYLINTARGELIDEEALSIALKEKLIKGAALDVFCSEPPSHEFASLAGTVFTPHIGGCTVDSAKNLALMSFENVMNFKNNQPLLNRLV